MKPKLKQYLKFTAIFVVGLTVGIIIMGYLSQRASKTFLEVFRANYSHEQIELASQARRNGDKYAEFVYRNNAVDILPMGKWKTIEKMKTAWDFTFPLSAPILDRIISSSDLEKGRKISFAVELGRLAEATENLGLKDEAEKLWNESAKLMGHNDIGKVRSLVASLNKSDDTTNTESSRK